MEIAGILHAGNCKRVEDHTGLSFRSVQARAKGELPVTYSVKKENSDQVGFDPRRPRFVVSDLVSFLGICSRENGVTVTLDLLSGCYWSKVRNLRRPIRALDFWLHQRLFENLTPTVWAFRWRFQNVIRHRRI